jgi:hypothetical protein
MQTLKLSFSDHVIDTTEYDIYFMTVGLSFDDYLVSCTFSCHAYIHRLSHEIVPCGNTGLKFGKLHLTA